MAKHWDSFLSDCKYYPKVGVIDMDEFNRDVALSWGVNVVSCIRIFLSLVFKIHPFCDMCWEIVLLSPVNLFVFVSEFSDEDYCCQGVLVFVLCFKDVQGKPDLC